MNLDLKPLHFQNVIMKCLSIESVEYCYFIPILSQLAEYWGDEKTAYLCKIMSRQIKQHLNHATHLHLLLSGQLKDHFLFDDTLQTLLQSNKLDKEKPKFVEFQLSHQSIPKGAGGKFSDQNILLTRSLGARGTTENLTFTSWKKINNAPTGFYGKERKIFLKLKAFDNFFFHLLENNNIKWKKQQFNVNSISENLSLCRGSSFRDHWHRDKIIDKDSYFLLLEILRYRKICKAEQWYPFVSTLALNHRLFQFSCSFIQLSQSEKEMSRLVRRLITK